MRRFLQGAVQRKVADAAEAQAPLTCLWEACGSVLLGPTLAKSENRKWRMQEGVRPAPWRSLSITSVILGSHIDWHRTYTSHCVPTMWLRKSGCHTFHVPQFHQGEERNPPHLSGFWNLHNSSLRRNITSLSSLLDLGCVVLQCWEEAFYFNFAVFTISRGSANIKMENSQQIWPRDLVQGQGSEIVVWHQGTEETCRATLGSESTAKWPEPLGP